MAGSERGNVAKYRHINGDAVVGTVTLGFIVETETPGVYEISRTGPPAKVWVETETPGVYEAGDGVADARTAFVGGVARIL